LEEQTDWEENMNFADAIKNGFKNYVQFRGVASRSEFWYWTLFTFLVALVLGTIDAVMLAASTSNEPMNSLNASFGLANIASIAFFLPNLSVGIRRMRDAGFSAWYLVLQALPLITLVLAFSALLTEIVALSGQSDLVQAFTDFARVLAYLAMANDPAAFSEVFKAFSGTFMWFGITALLTLAIGVFFLVVYTRPTKTFEQGNKLVAPTAAPISAWDAGTTA